MKTKKNYSRNEETGSQQQHWQMYNIQVPEGEAGAPVASRMSIRNLSSIIPFSSTYSMLLRT